MREMKDSGIEWIGEIPRAWKLNKIGAIYEERNTKVSDLEYEPLSVTKQGIVPQLETAAKTDNGDNRKLIRKNDFVINSRSDRRGSCGISDYDGSCSLINTVLKPRGNMNNKYYSFVFKSDNFADEFYRWGHGIVNDLWSTKWSDMKNIYIPSPTIDEQKRIADYLDKKCSKIDAIIEKQQEIIEKLKEYKLSIISEAVTKGLNPDVEMKDSEVEWIGKIPAHWSLVKAKYYVDITNGSDPKEEGDIPVYGSGEKSFKTCGEYKEGPCVLIGRKGATLNIPHYIVGKYWNVDTAFDVKTKKGMLLKYYFYLANCFDYNKFISQTTLPGMTQTNYNNMLIPVPSVEEQEDIVRYLDEKIKKIDCVLENCLKLLNNNANYKRSLIYEVVTGKREV